VLNVRPNVICWDEKRILLGSALSGQKNVVVSMRVSTHALSEMGNYRKKTSVYRLGTKVVSKLVLFVKLTISTETVF